MVNIESAPTGASQREQPKRVGKFHSVAKSAHTIGSRFAATATATANATATATTAAGTPASTPRSRSGVTTTVTAATTVSGTRASSATQAGNGGPAGPRYTDRGRDAFCDSRTQRLLKLSARCLCRVTRRYKQQTVLELTVWLTHPRLPISIRRSMQ